jgi:16S rRNA (uracil1498-N3)-methyltransferase
MRRRFFVDEVRSGRAEIRGDDANHLTRVLRVEAGERYEISDNRDVFLAEIETARKEHVVFRALEKLPATEPEAHVVLCAALIKFDHFEWMIEKATEMGVAKIIPVIATRSEYGLERAAQKRIERWRRIAVEASQQSRRAFLPEIELPVSFGAALAKAASHKYVLDEDPVALPIASAIPAVRNISDEITVLIGPEGGWTDEERAGFTNSQWTAVSLGPLILRAETAAVAALAMISLSWRRLH